MEPSKSLGALGVKCMVTNHVFTPVGHRDKKIYLFSHVELEVDSHGGSVRVPGIPGPIVLSTKVEIGPKNPLQKVLTIFTM